MRPEPEIYNSEVERAFLGGILLDNRWLGRCLDEYLPSLDQLAPANPKRDDTRKPLFCNPANETIWQAILAIRAERSEGFFVDLVILGEYLDRIGKYEAVGSAEYLAWLEEEIVCTLHLPVYSQILCEKWKARSIGKAALDASEAVKSASDPAIVALSAMQTLGPLAESKGKNPPQSVGESMAGMLAEIEDRRARVKETGGIIGVRTGHRWIDFKTGGLRPGQLVIVAARPSVGKTSLAIQMAAGIARNSGPVLFLSLEMDRTELNERLLGIEAEINISDIRRGTLNAAEHERLIETALRIQSLPLITDERTDGSIELIRSRIEHENAKQKLSAVFVDYLQLIEGAKDTDETRAGVVSEITRGLKLAAKSLKIPVIALSQLNRQAAQGQGSKKAKPELHHLRESGSIEQDADIVIMLDRDPKADQGEIRIAKGRSDGATAWEPIGFTRKFARWEQA